jgi:outer membrane protein assembly factor BamA
LEQGLDFVKRSLQSEGYWSAEVTLRETTVNKDSGEVDVANDVQRGPRFRIGNPSVDSPDGRGVKRAATTWEPFIGSWATTETIIKLNKEMVEAFASRGYPDAEVFLSRRLGKDTYHPEFRIELGVRVKLLEVESEGLNRTEPKRVQEIMAPLEGDWYDQDAMNQKVSDLLATGAFSSVRIETREVARKRINATLHFEESKAKEIALSAGAGSFYGPLFRAQYLDRNFRGKLRAFSAGMEINGRGLLGELKLTDPWWRGTDLTRELRLFSLLREYDGYTTFEAGLGSTWRWDVTDHFSMALLLGYSFVTTDEEGLPERFLGESPYHHPHVRLTPKWDYRDNPLLPKSGWHLSFPLQFGAAVKETSQSYMKLGAKGGWYMPIGKSYQLGIGGFAEWVSPSDNIDDLPVDLRVFNGGARSVRSFPERELGPNFNGDPFGGDFSWAIQNELSRKIGGPLRLVGFVDAGGVSGSYTSSEGGGLEVAAGLGLRIDLPIGPMRLEYGHNLTQDRGEPSGTWHFAIGATF